MPRCRTGVRIGVYAPSGVFSLMLGGLTAYSETCKVVATIDSVAICCRLQSR
jgi:hypothetical protein